ncbi:hypothetical protein EV385_0201 [Krasilnikovia cinnamomea]|uniref:Uncharacterized protein n=1 Tax=Krasilnikovia cinnamomea TaxID=349313 RepID=A0A4Q7ZDZ4_9ACTN|nr:hypothetical protein EV385_0201 [Krasilnikovia cinnamomea]
MALRAEPYTSARQEIAGPYLHHRLILTEAMPDGTAVPYTQSALQATGFRSTWNSGAARPSRAAHRIRRSRVSTPNR